MIDIQNDFLPGGALEVKEGDRIIPVVNQLIKRFKLVVATKDWHPADHKSFASNHEGSHVGDIIKLKGLDQILWPDHCIQGTSGAEFSEGLNAGIVSKIFIKGTDPDIDSYSGFFDNGHLRSTGLSLYLRSQHVDEVYIVGLATDYCVKYTALDSIQEGFKTFVIVDGTRAVNLQSGDYDKALKEMENAGVKILTSKGLFQGDDRLRD